MVKMLAALICCTALISRASSHWDPRGKHLSHGSFSQTNQTFVRCNRCGHSFYRNNNHTCISCARCFKVHMGNCAQPLVKKKK